MARAQNAPRSASNVSTEPASGGRLRTWGSTLPVVLLLVAVIGYGTAELLHGQLLALGEHWWPEYHQLRHDPEEPSCDPNAIAVAAPVDEEEEDLLDDILDDEEDEEAGQAPGPGEAEPPSPQEGEDEGDDDEALLDDLIDDDDDDDDKQTGRLDAAAAAGLAAEAALTKCRDKHALYEDIQARLTPGVIRFRTFETGVAAAVHLAVEHFQHILVLILLLCAITATAIRSHISLRPARYHIEERTSQVTQLIANLMLAYSAYAKRSVDQASGIAIDHETLPILWMLGFTAMAALNVGHLIRPPSSLEPGGQIRRGLLAVPLYTTMCLIAGGYFLLSEGYTSGLSTYLGRLPEHAILYIHVGLYVWAGMLLKQTRLATLFFDLIRPWKLPPELLAFVVVAFAAIPTAFSGASGIFVIAVGGVIYQELRRAGARRQLALAATAMSGSLGVVLRPCLLVVIVASLNQEVTTDQLFLWGTRVFMLTAGLFAVAALMVRDAPLTMAPPREGLSGSVAALRPLIPYAIVFGVLVMAYAFGLNAHLDEHSAPFILPVILMAVLVLDRSIAKRSSSDDEAPGRRVTQAIGDATHETTEHIGALLTLMGLSICLGGIVERAEVMSLVPATFGSVWLAMSLLVVVLVIIGMTMDPYGAVILVSATIASVAYRNGIDPVHFWMVVLVAFELGYLTPPVALNHLLTRQVVGIEEARLADLEGDTFWRRHERILLPVSVMATALIIVAFLPLLLAA
jgi:TRAP-type C4-dicarboxylate transport system permease large subunit